MQSPDGLVAAPWGDLLFCEDGRGRDRLMGITPEGGVYELAANGLGIGELAGCCFSPDGQTMFISIQEPGITFAVWGPFSPPDSARRRRLAAGSPGDFGPRLGRRRGGVRAAQRPRPPRGGGVPEPLRAAALAL